MSESIHKQTVEEKNNCYPEPVVFDDHYSILMIAFDHQVNRSTLGNKKRRNEYAKLLHNQNWQVHDYLQSCEQPDKRKGVLRFQPDKIMTPHAHEVFFGESLLVGDENSVNDTVGFIEDRLNPDIGTVGLSESLMFSLSKSDWMNTPLVADDSRNQFEFEIKWADLFLYNDGTGLLAIKVHSIADENGISDLSLMNRVLRDFKNDFVKVSKKEGSNSDKKNFWGDVVLHDWLGFGQTMVDQSFMSKLLGNDEDISGLLLVPAGAPSNIFDRFQRYCKVMVTAQMPDLSEGEVGMQWGRPIADPPVYFTEKHYQALHSGEWNSTLAAAQKAIGAGYATVRDLVMFELAVVSAEQTSTGWKGGRGWQYGAEYIRKVVDNNFVEIWEYWAAIALRDTCVFVSYDKSMPIIWQAESFYYPLYALAYHNHYKLDCMSRSIIDYDMADALNGRKVRDEFQRFRNQYWFQDVTTDFQGVEVYNQMKHGMGMNEQYETVSAEIADVSDHLQEKWDRGTRSFFTVLAIMLAPLMELWNTWLIPHVKEAPIEELLQIAGGIVIVLLIAVIVWLKFKKRILSFVRKLSRRFHRIVGVMGNN